MLFFSIMNHSLSQSQKDSLKGYVIVELDIDGWDQVTPENIDKVVDNAFLKVSEENHRLRGMFYTPSKVLIQGHPVATYRLVKKLKEANFIPVSAHSKRVSKEVQIDGKTVKKNIFEHLGWIEY